MDDLDPARSDTVGIEALFRAVFDVAPVPLLLLVNDPPRFTMVAVNTMHALAFRTTVEGLTGRGVFEVFPPNPEPVAAEFMANIRASFDRVLASGRHDAMPIKPFAVVGADGQADERYWSALNAPVIGPDGRISHIVSSVRDATGEVFERRAEEARTLLMNEVDHRARNALTVVQSIVRLTEAADVATFKAVTMGRVDALARAQTSLSHRRWEGGDLHEVIAQEIAALALDSRVRLSGPRILLSAEQVQGMSMLVHELATNARKYGSLSVAGGTVAASWTTPNPDALVIVWTERGGPPAAEPAQTGFGHRLVTRMGRQLGGEVRHDWRPEGLTVTFEVGI